MQMNKWQLDITTIIAMIYSMDEVRNALATSDQRRKVTFHCYYSQCFTIHKMTVNVYCKCKVYNVSVSV